MVLFFWIFFVTFIEGFVIKSHLLSSTMTQTHISLFDPKKTVYTYTAAREPKQTGDDETAILLIHGFGSSHHHWRSNIPVLSESYDTYAIDLLGFGSSEKSASSSYNISMWTEQVLTFIDQVIQKPCILVGNSLGAYIGLAAASADSKKMKIRGVIAINPAVISKMDKPITFNWFSSKSVIKTYFQFAKKRSTIQFFLKSLYPVFPERVDDSLLDSIENPSRHPNATEVFYRVLMENVLHPTTYIEDILENITAPLLVIYGEKDPWINIKTVKKITDIYPKSGFITVKAGHCPQDEIPEIVNPLILFFMTTL